MYSIVDGKIVNESGDIAIRYRQEIPKYLKFGKNEYVFSVQHHVSLAWVHPEDADRIASLVGGCCGGTASLTKFASEHDIKMWLGDI